MGRVRTAGIATVIALISLTGLITPQSVAAQADGPRLMALIHLAESSRNYALTVMDAASAHGLGTTSSMALLTAGDDSLNIARASLASNANFAAGVEAAQSAMQSFTDAAVSASNALQNAGLISTVEVDGVVDGVAATNESVARISAVLIKTCSTIPLNSTHASEFQNDCISGEADITDATSGLNLAASMIARVRAGQAGANLSESASLLARARGSLAKASALLGNLSAFTYFIRGETFVRGPIAKDMGTANASAAAQETLVAKLDSVASGVEALAGPQGAAVDNISTSVSLVANAITAADTARVITSVSVEEMILSQTKSNLTNLYQQLPVTLPLNVITQLQTAIAEAQSNLSDYNLALVGLGAQANSFPQTSLTGFASYSANFGTNAGTTETKGQAFISSYAALQTQLGSAVNQFPLLQSLAQWQTTLNVLGARINSGSSDVNTSLHSAQNAFTLLKAKIDVLISGVASSSAQIQVGVGIVQNITMVYSSEGRYLNASRLTELGQAVTLLQSTAQMASDFTTSSQSLLQFEAGQFSSAAAKLGVQGSSLKAQTVAAVNMITTASIHLEEDLKMRIHAVALAKTMIAEALQLLADLQVPQGVSFLVQASAELQVAASRST